VPAKTQENQLAAKSKPEITNLMNAAERKSRSNSATTEDKGYIPAKFLMTALSWRTQIRRVNGILCPGKTGKTVKTRLPTLAVISCSLAEIVDIVLGFSKRR